MCVMGVFQKSSIKHILINPWYKRWCQNWISDVYTLFIFPRYSSDTYIYLRKTKWTTNFYSTTSIQLLFYHTPTLNWCSPLSSCSQYLGYCTPHYKSHPSEWSSACSHDFPRYPYLRVRPPPHAPVHRRSSSYPISAAALRVEGQRSSIYSCSDSGSRPDSCFSSRTSMKGWCWGQTCCNRCDRYSRERWSPRLRRRMCWKLPWMVSGRQCCSSRNWRRLRRVSRWQSRQGRGWGRWTEFRHRASGDEGSWQRPFCQVMSKQQATFSWPGTYGNRRPNTTTIAIFRTNTILRPWTRRMGIANRATSMATSKAPMIFQRPTCTTVSASLYNQKIKAYNGGTFWIDEDPGVGEVAAQSDQKYRNNQPDGSCDKNPLGHTLMSLLWC